MILSGLRPARVAVFLLVSLALLPLVARVARAAIRAN